MRESTIPSAISDNCSVVTVVTLGSMVGGVLDRPLKADWSPLVMVVGGAIGLIGIRFDDFCEALKYN